MTGGGDTDCEPRPGNKLCDAHENPVDRIILRLTRSTLPAWRATGHTPNVITAYSFAAAVAGLYCLIRGRVVAFAVLWTLGYVLDCLDGQMARTYDQVTRFGDWFDHATDAVALGGLVAVVVVRYRCVVRPRELLALLVFGALTAVHMGCQQTRFHGASSSRGSGGESLDRLRGLCLDPDRLHWLRWFGSGSFHLVVILLVPEPPQKNRHGRGSGSHLHLALAPADHHDGWW